MCYYENLYRTQEVFSWTSLVLVFAFMFVSKMCIVFASDENLNLLVNRIGN